MYIWEHEVKLNADKGLPIIWYGRGYITLAFIQEVLCPHQFAVLYGIQSTVFTSFHFLLAICTLSCAGEGSSVIIKVAPFVQFLLETEQNPTLKGVCVLQQCCG